MKCEIKEGDRSWVTYSNVFGNDCMMLECMRGSKGNNKLGIKLFRMPMDVKYYLTEIVWTAYFDNERMIVRNDNVILKVQRRGWMPILMDDMKGVDVLSFKVEIKVKKIERR